MLCLYVEQAGGVISGACVREWRASVRRRPQGAAAGASAGSNWIAYQDDTDAMRTYKRC